MSLTTTTSTTVIPTPSPKQPRIPGPQPAGLLPLGRSSPPPLTPYPDCTQSPVSCSRSRSLQGEGSGLEPFLSCHCQSRCGPPVLLLHAGLAQCRNLHRESVSCWEAGNVQALPRAASLCSCRDVWRPEATYSSLHLPICEMGITSLTCQGCCENYTKYGSTSQALGRTCGPPVQPPSVPPSIHPWFTHTCHGVELAAGRFVAVEMQPHLPYSGLRSLLGEADPKQ